MRKRFKGVIEDISKDFLIFCIEFFHFYLLLCKSPVNISLYDIIFLYH